MFFDDASKSGIAMLTSDGKVRLALKETGSEVHLVCEGKITIEAKGDMSFKAAGHRDDRGQRRTRRSRAAAPSRSRAALIKLN